MQSIFSYLLILSLGMLVFHQHTKPPASASAEPPIMNGIRTKNDYSTESLVRDIFAKGACDNISNIRSIGNREGIGYFENGRNVIGMENGIIISTGQIEHAEGPNQAGDKSGTLGNTAGDQDLGMFVDQRVLDVVGIEFDFVPLDSFVRFRYVFASEEYCEFVGSVYNDVFGFFVSGPGIEGEFSNQAKNVALIPGTNDYVAINSVNHAYNSQYFIRNELERDARQCEIEPFNSPHRNSIEYDGFTTILTATLQLVPCETYHIRFVVADVADRYYDSAVFLEAESFNIGGTVLLNAEAKETNKATEGCEDAFFVFKRGEQENLNKALTVQFEITDESTAIEGIDFEPLPRQVTIPAGKMNVRLPVKVINDRIDEPDEKIVIALDIPCACYSGDATMLLTDPPPLIAQLTDKQVCRNSTATLRPEINGGIPPYSYRWSNGALTPEIEINPGLASIYTVTISDQCGNSTTDTCRISIIESPEAQLTGFAEICSGDTAFLSILLNGAPPWSLTYMINDEIQPIIEGIQANHFSLPASQHGIYKIKTLQDANCEGIAEGHGEINLIQVSMDTQVQAVSCNAGADGGIAVYPKSGNAPYQFHWDHTNVNTAQLNNLQAGVYTLTIIDHLGCASAFTIEVPEPKPLAPIIFDCKDLTDTNFDFSASGGTPPYQYATDGVTFSDYHFFEQLIPGTTYQLTIRDANGCELQQTLTLPPTYEQMVELPEVLEIKIGESFTIVPKLNIPEGLVANVRWLPGENLSCIDCLNPQTVALQETSYTIRVIDLFGCTGEATVRIKLDREVDVFIPTAFSPDGDHVNDRFTVFANPHQVRRVIAFQVFDRWGSQVFVAEDFLPNDEDRGWDGHIGNKLPNAGIFVYMAKLELVDGTEIIRKGQVLLVR